MVSRLAAGQHRPGTADTLVVFDAGYGVTRLALLLADLPIGLVGRLPPGRPPRHGPELRLADPASLPTPAHGQVNSRRP